MYRIYDETDLTWSSVEKYYQYGKVVWFTRQNGIPIYTLLDDDGNKISIGLKID